MKKIIGIILIFCLMLSLCACGSKIPELTKTDKVMPLYYTVKKGDICSVNIGNGSIMPMLSEVYFEIDGKISEINFRLGDKVKAGDVIYSLNEDLKKDNERTEKELEKYSEISSYYDKENEKKINDMKKRLAGLNGYEKEIYETEIAEAELNLELEAKSRKSEELALREALEEGKRKEEKSVVKAPCDGTIVYMAYQGNDDAAEFTLACVIADNSKKYFCYDYKSDKELKGIDSTELIIGGESYTDLTLLKYTDEELREAKDYNKTLYSRYDFSDKDLEIGTYGCVIDRYDSCKDVLYVPNECIYEDDESGKLYVLRKEEEKERAITFVEAGNVCDNYTEITDGLNEGDMIFWCDDEHNSNYKYTETVVKNGSFSIETEINGINKSFYNNNKFYSPVPGRIDQIFIDKTSDIYVNADTKILSIIPSVKETDYEKAKIEYESNKLEYDKKIKEYNNSIEENKALLKETTDIKEQQYLNIEIGSLEEELEDYIADNSEKLEKLKRKADNYEIWMNGEPVTVYAGYDGIFNTVNSISVGSGQRADQIIAFISDPDKFYLSIPDRFGEGTMNIRYGAKLKVSSINNSEPVSFEAEAYNCYNTGGKYNDIVLGKITDGSISAEKISDIETKAVYEFCSFENVPLIDIRYVNSDEKGNTYVLLKVDENGSLVKKNIKLVLKNDSYAWVFGLNEGDIISMLDK